MGMTVEEIGKKIKEDWSRATIQVRNISTKSDAHSFSFLIEPEVAMRRNYAINFLILKMKEIRTSLSLFGISFDNISTQWLYFDRLLNAKADVEEFIMTLSTLEVKNSRCTIYLECGDEGKFIQLKT
ncbi:hypothetical protein Tco_0643671 [Tanacetum coccineum]